MAEREFMGAAFRLTMDFIEKQGLRESVGREVSAETRRMIDKPPGQFSWIDSRPMDELFAAVEKVAGRKANFDLGLLAGREFGGSLVQPVIKAALTFFGGTPATLFSNLDRFFPMVTRGYRFGWEPQGDRAGTIEARWEGPGVPSAIFDTTHGNLTYFAELTTKGTVSPPEVMRHDASGAVVRYRAAW
jgi:hypothetical protein